MKRSQTLNILWWPVLGISALALYCLVMVLSAGQSVWFDEGYSILLAKSSWNELFALTAVDAHPPFYYVLLKVWGTLFGFSEFALRSLSAILLSSGLVVTMLFLRRVFSTKLALLALPFLVVAPFMLRYGYEVRMYSLALLIAVSATYALILAQANKQWWRWVIYALLVALGMYTLYMTVVVWLAHLIWLVVMWRKENPKQPFWKLQWIYGYIGAVILFAPYIPTFLYQTFHSALPGIGSEVTLTKLVDSFTTLFVYTPEWKLGGWLSLLLITAVGLFLIVATRTHRLLSVSEKKYYLLILTIVITAIGFYALTSLPPRDPIFVNRYLAHVSVFIYLLVAVMLAFGVIYRSKQKKALKTLPVMTYGLVLVILSFGVIQLSAAGNFIFERMQHPETQAIRNSIDCKDAVIVADDPYTYIDSVFYFDGCDMRYFSKSELEKKGGYAPLTNTQDRITSSQELDSPVIVHLGWNGNEPQFSVDARYERESSTVFGNQLVEKYQLIEE
jgi:mannosyltransferase